MKTEDKKLSKSEAEEKIENFFKKENLKSASQREVKKIKRLAANKKIPLKEKRKLFCKNCLIPYARKRPKIRIKNGMKIVECSNCGYVSRYKPNNFKNSLPFKQ